MRLGRVALILFLPSFQCQAFDSIPAAQNVPLATVIHVVSIGYGECSTLRLPISPTE
jgi:hypothetical protein